MSDQSHLDERYFVDAYVYNCPFCNRRNVAYTICGHFTFDWTTEKKCRVFLVRCHSCGQTSMHLTFKDFAIERVGNYSAAWRFALPEDVEDVGVVLDRAFFYSVPTSFFVLDERVPRVLRELLTEAEGCLKSNFLTGASACARKIVYELASLKKAEGGDYETRIKSLKKAHPEIEPTYFDTLLTVQQVTSDKVHEGSFDGWESKHLRVILASLAEILREIYVVPAQREDRRRAILDLRQEVLAKKKADSTGEEAASAGAG